MKKVGSQAMERLLILSSSWSCSLVFTRLRQGLRPSASVSASLGSLCSMVLKFPSSAHTAHCIYLFCFHLEMRILAPSVSSVTQSCPTLCDPMNRSTPGLPVHHQLPEFTQTHMHQVGHAIQASHPLSSPSPPAPNPSQHQGLFQGVNSFGMRWPKYWSFSFSISPSKKHPGLISFRMDWLDLLAVQGTLKSLLQHHSSKASILHRSAFFTVQLSHSYMTTGKTIALTTQTLLAK